MREEAGRKKEYSVYAFDNVDNSGRLLSYSYLDAAAIAQVDRTHDELGTQIDRQFVWHSAPAVIDRCQSLM